MTLQKQRMDYFWARYVTGTGTVADKTKDNETALNGRMNTSPNAELTRRQEKT